MAKLNVRSRFRGNVASAIVLLLLAACQRDGASPPPPPRSTTGPAASPGDVPPAVISPIDGGGQTVTRTPGTASGPARASAPAPGPPGVIVRLAGLSAFEAHALVRARGTNAARAAAATQRNTLRAQHGRILGALAGQLGGLASRRGRGTVVGAAYDDFTDVLNGVALYGVDLPTATRLLHNERDVVSIEAMTEVHATLPESVPLIDADDVWALNDSNGVTIDGTGMRIGIVDTGVDYTHPDLGGCFGPGCKVAGGYDFVNNDADPMDDFGHGTHVAATAAGKGTYAGPSGPVPIPGVAPGAEIYAYKVLNAAGSGSNADIIAAVERCADPNGDGDPSDHLDVCNLSLGGGGNPDDATSTAVDNATASGVVFAIAAGNGGPSADTIGSPGTSRRAITVAAACKPSSIGVDSRCAQQIASFSSRGPVLWNGASGPETLAKPDVAAPGVSICAAEWGTYESGSRCLDGRHIALSGTSMAAPHVAGVAALLRQAHPEWTPDQVKTFIVTSAHDLGLEAAAEGTGRVDALDALTLGGIPSSIARIGGTPLRDLDVPTARFATFTSAITVTNTSSQALTFTGAFAGDPGLTATLTPGSLPLDPGATGTISVARQVDHDVVASGTTARGTITLSTPSGNASVGLEVGVRSRLTAAPATADLGVDLASQSTWTGQATIQLTNTLTDSPATYTASIACCNAAFQSGGTAITASLDSSAVNLAPGGTASLGVTVQATNATLANGRFEGTITLSSPLGTLLVPVTFFKGYGVKLDTTPRLPETLALSSEQSGSTVVYPVTDSSMTFLSTTPGPFFAEAKWPGGGVPYVNYHVLAGNLATDVPIREVTLDLAQALYTIELRPTDQAGASPTMASVIYRFTHSASGGGVPVMFGFGTGTKIAVSTIPSGVNFTADVVAFSPDPIAYFYELPGPASADATFTNTAADLVTKDLRVVRPVSANNAPFFVPWACLPMPYHALPGGAMTGGGAICANSWTGSGVSLPSGVGTIRFYNSANRDFTAAQYPDAPSVQYDVLDGSSTGATLYSGPYMNVSAARAFSWSIPFPHTSSIRVEDVYANFACDDVPGSVLTFGPGPMVDQWSWYNHQTDVFTFRPYKGGFEEAFSWGGCVQEDDPTTNPSSYSLSLDGVVVTSGSLASLSTLFPPAAPGAYRFELSRPAVIGGVSTQVDSISTFTVSQTASIDENPPRLRSLHVVGRGLWQEVLDPATVNRLQFGLDPVPGLDGVNPAPPPQFTQLADALTSVTLQQSSDGQAWASVPVSLRPDGTYATDELSLTSAPLTWFRISASDTAGNTLQHTFQVPLGTGYAATGSDTTPPTTAITAPAPGDTVTGIVPVSAIASDDTGVARVDLFVDGVRAGSAAASPYAFSWNSATVSSGAHQLITRAYDAAENVGQSAPVAITVQNSDQTPPTVAFTAPNDGALVRSTIAVAANAADDNAVAHVDFYYDGSSLIGSVAQAPYATSWTTTGAPDGVHPLRAVAFDAAGNTATSSLQVTVDNTPPVAAITAPLNAATVAGTVPFTVTASDANGVARVDFYADAQLIGSATSLPYSTLWNTALVGLGAHTLSAVAFDNAGNSASTALVNVTVSTDVTPPTIAITAPAEGAAVTGSVWFSAAASDNIGVTKVEWYDGATLLRTTTFTPYSIGWDTSSAPAGPNTLTARAYDAAGNSTLSAPVHVIVDRTPPTVAILAPTSPARVTGVVAIDATASDNIAVGSVTFYDNTTTIGTVTAPPYSIAWNTFATTDGVHNVTVRAFDSAGNHADAFLTATVDNSVTVSLAAPAEGALVGSAATVTATTSNDGAVASIAFFDGSTAIGSVTTAPFSVIWNPTSSGAHSLTAQATDRDGRTTTSPALAVTADVSPPTVALTTPANGATVSKGVSVAATASDNVAVARVEFYLDGGVLLGASVSAPYAISWDTTTTPAGSHTLTAKAFDTVGNATTSAAQTVVVKDVTAPTVAITSPANGSKVSAGAVVTIAATASDLDGVSKVTFSVSGQVKCTVSAAPYTCNWTVPSKTGKSYTLQAKAVDTANNTGASANVTVTAR